MRRSEGQVDTVCEYVCVGELGQETGLGLNYDERRWVGRREIQQYNFFALQLFHL